MDDAPKIEHGIELPKGGKAWCRFPFGEMGVGDSLFAAGSKPKSPGYRLSMAAYQWGARHSVKFVSRCVDGGMRVWRVK